MGLLRRRVRKMRCLLPRAVVEMFYWIIKGVCYG